MTDHQTWMKRAFELAERGRGFVEPNPVVGCVLVRDGQLVGEGWHQKYGGPHAEVEALRAAGNRALGATAYVTLEPCDHFGKTPPCSEALIAAGVRCVVAAIEDPFPQVAGRGLARLRQAGVEVHCGLESEQARRQNGPFFKRVQSARPWVIAKWAMSLDGKIATATGESQWISSAAARAHAHQVRGRMDGIVVGIETALADNPQLTARPPGPRQAWRIVVDSSARLELDSRLVATAREIPVCLAVGPQADPLKLTQLEQLGVKVWQNAESDRDLRLDLLLKFLSEQGLTNLLVEGGGELLAGLARLQQIDEIWAYVAPRLIGGRTAAGPVGGSGIARLSETLNFQFTETISLDPDFALHAVR